MPRVLFSQYPRYIDLTGIHWWGKEATAGFEPANGGFADLCLKPLGYVAIQA